MAIPELRRVQDEVLSWGTLKAPQPEIETRLTLFLEGLAFPLAPGEEPYEVLVQIALETGTDRTLAEPAAKLLERWRDQTWQPVIALRARYNLLRLSAELEAADLLRGPVWALFDARKDLVHGAHEGGNLRSALLAAMIRNQPEDSVGAARAKELWENLLAERPVPDLPGLLIDGFHGLIGMPHLPGMTTAELEYELGRALAPVWRRAHATGRQDLFDREFRYLMDLHPGLDGNSILWAADVLPAVPQLFLRQARLKIGKIADPVQREELTAAAEEVIQRVIFDTQWADLNADNLGKIIRKNLPKRALKLVGEYTFPPNPIPTSESAAGKRSYQLSGQT